MYIKTFALELDMRQRTMAKIKVPCEYDQKIIVYISNIYTRKLFTNCKMTVWENSSPTIYELVPTAKPFAKLWTNRITFLERENGARPFDNAATVNNLTGLTHSLPQRMR